MSDSAPLLDAHGITKTYPGTTALDDVHFSLQAGEVHALMGENGAGKSTLIKILTGAESRDGGTIALDGQEVALGSSAVAQKSGVWAVHQEVMVLPNLTVAENLLLGSQPRRFGLIDRKTANRIAKDTLTELGLDLDVARPLGAYPVAIRQLVAIARAVHAKARVLVLDEPTASLDAPEVERLFDLVRKLASRGTGIVFITHFLDQVYALSDRITVLRNGKSLGTFAASDLPRDKLVSMMIGKELQHAEAGEHRCEARAGAAVVRFSGTGKKGSVEPFDLALHEGEAVGAAGLLGSGRTETALLMFGIDRAEGGSVEVDGKSARLRSPRDAVRYGLAFSPEDRKTDAIFADLSIRDNVVIALQAKRGWLRKLSRREQQELADRYIAQMNIRTSDADKPIGKLSGGNQQKVLLGRWLATNPRVLILDEPTRGIDVGAHAEIVKMIENLRDNGMALYVISSELEELITYSDRISVMQDRRQVQILEGDDLTVAKIVAAIAAPVEKAAA
ncbi:sugar ABC transporter ATP-binding protein [Sphingomonas piscis]|uniref:Sugar ABC transporter ATP-binding protein n=1 Tax=Sphingomonas piscis TaxID=2714943 RepID=A0A6G7YQH9_9SPHN|nr:sugar ABC transporter ATP-binding protein [Sphingomonas piscis]QIK78992.1 sugar ABC transporter ATP-binding protein [Sphingomonas piscis]